MDMGILMDQIWRTFLYSSVKADVGLATLDLGHCIDNFPPVIYIGMQCFIKSIIDLLVYFL